SHCLRTPLDCDLFPYPTLFRSGALVQLVPAQEATRAWSAHTGANGAFSFDSVEAGRYLLGFYHALLDSLGVTPPLSRIDVRAGRSEEHTSELQSRENLVCRLLL